MPMGSGVVQSSMKALASGSEAMWAAAILLWARIRARMASMVLTELFSSASWPSQGSVVGSQALVELSDCCCFRSLPRLGALVDQILFERQVAQPPLPLDPEILEVLPY